jgi:hypothetical protein
MISVPAWLTSLGARVVGWFVLAGAGLVALWGAERRGRAQGKSDVINADLKQGMADHAAAAKAETEVAGLSDRAVIDELHRSYDRK